MAIAAQNIFERDTVRVDRTTHGDDDLQYCLRIKDVRFYLSEVERVQLAADLLALAEVEAVS